MIELRPPSTLINFDADHSSCGDLLLRQPLVLAQADQFAAQERALNHRPLITRHDQSSLSVAMWTPVEMIVCHLAIGNRLLRRLSIHNILRVTRCLRITPTGTDLRMQPTC